MRPTTLASRDAVITSALRTPMGRGRPSGALAGVHAVELLSQLFDPLLGEVDPAAVDDVLIGCVSQVGEQSGTPGRQAWLAAGLPEQVPSVTIERKCGSGQQAVQFAAAGIMAGVYDIVVAGGVESMSRVPMGSARLDADPFGPLVTARFPGMVPQGISAELVAARWGISRPELDEYAARSHRLAHGAVSDFAREISPVLTPAGLVTADETIRPTSTAATLAELKPAFQSAPGAERYPELTWSMTAGNSSQITDGAGAVLLMSRDRAETLGLRPRARITYMTAVGDDPVLMLGGPIPATRKLLAESGYALSDFDHIEINEAFASIPLAWMREFDVIPDRVNPRGGAIALGHPLGASGTRLLTTMLHALEDNDGTLGMQVMCEAGGMANILVLERL
ncbi:thiolase family protein [Streptomyces sp. NPDC097610]|uniref:thiolase family protein n=1 Tax=Streptomyces sp. NPDC097610 TaxID=3157227 RepID=UPI0033313901